MMRRRAAITVMLAPLLWGGSVAHAQTPVDIYDLVDYRLTPEVFEQFAQASVRIAEITRTDPAFTYAPLFTKEIALSGDAPAMATGLMARLESHMRLSDVLREAKLTPREYAKFAISLIGAHLAHGFINAGVLRSVPSGAPTINVEFVKTHQTQVGEILAELGIK